MVSIGELLLDAGLTRDQLEECRGISAVSGDSIDRVILAKDFMEEGTLLQIYAKHLGYEFRKSLDGTKVPGTFVDSVPVNFARNYNLVALESGDGVLKVATCSPLDPHPMDDLAAMIGTEVDAVLAPTSAPRSSIGCASSGEQVATFRRPLPPSSAIRL